MTSATNPKTIELYGFGCQHEAKAAGVITPGMLVERAADGEVQAHSTEGGNANPHFANEYGLTGGTISDNYAADDQVIFTTYNPGSGVYALLANGENASENALLTSKGDGSLAVAAAGDIAIAQAREALNNATGSAARIKVEVLTPQTVPAAS